jgi:DNA-binding MarR family transcriptional regulator
MNQEIMMALGYVGHAHKHMVGHRLEGIVSRGQPPVLWYLERHDGCIQRELAENCHIKAASVSSVLDNMEQCGCIRRHALEGDRRAQRVYLTEEGWAKCEMVKGVFRQMEERCLAGIGKEELNAFRETLEKIIANMRAIGGGEEKEEERADD